MFRRHLPLSVAFGWAPVWASAWAALSLLSLASLGGCETEQSYADKQRAEAAATRPDPVMVIRHHVGGTHHRILARGAFWYATFANSFLVISADTGTVLNSIELLPFGTCGGAVELAATDDPGTVYILLEGTAICEVSLADPKSPRVVAIRRSEELGFPPRAIAMARGQLWISGDGGVVPWAEVPARGEVPTASKDREKAKKKSGDASLVPPARLAEIARERGPIGPVVDSAQGLVATSGRRVLRVDDGAFVGAATRLDALPPETASRIGLPGGLLFILQGSEGAQVGLMSADAREVATRAIRGTARRVRVIGQELVAINDDEMTFFPITSDGGTVALGEPMYVMVKGALDVEQLNANYYGVVGSFGRAMWRRANDSGGPGDEFLAAQREPSDLRFAASDRRRILAGGPEGVWLYTVGDEVALVNRTIEGTDGRKPSVSAGWGKAAIADDKRSVRVIVAVQTKGVPPELTWRSRLGGEVFGVESLDGRLWIWHQDGVDVLSVIGGTLRPDASVRLEGPVRYLFPQRVGGAAAFVSELGGFGLLDFIERAALTTIPGERITDRDGDGEDDVILTGAEKAAGARGFTTKPTDMRTPEPAGVAPRQDP